MGPRARYLGPEVPQQELMWQDPIPEVQHPARRRCGRSNAQSEDPRIGRSQISQLVETAWASASTYRGSDKRGGANGGRLRLAPQKDWDVNQPAQLGNVLAALEKIQTEFNGAQTGGKRVSLADLIVLGGCAAVEKAAKDAGQDVKVPFTPGRGDASQEQTDVASFSVLEPLADGFRNYLKASPYGISTEELLIDRAQLLTLTAPEMTVLVGGLRALGANAGTDEARRVHRPAGDAHQRLLRQPARHGYVVEEDLGVRGALRRNASAPSGAKKWTATRADLIFGANSQLRAIAEVYGGDDAKGSSSPTSSPRGTR